MNTSEQEVIPRWLAAMASTWGVRGLAITPRNWCGGIVYLSSNNDGTHYLAATQGPPWHRGRRFYLGRRDWFSRHIVLPVMGMSAIVWASRA